MTATDLASIYNFWPLSEAIATAGQPTAEQFEAIQQAGYEVVINLAPVTSDKSLPNEQQLVEAHGMHYVHLPVRWEQPTQADLQQFFAVLEAHQDRKILVHCAANMRVSAFMYLYRRLRQGLSDAEARPDLHQIWHPNPVWQAFIAQATSLTDP